MLYILTLTWNACDKITTLKNSLIPALSDLDYTWLIKDNASKDDTVKVISDWGGKIRVIPYKDNLQNFSTGVNYLFNEASPKDDDYIMLLNNDVIINDPNSIKSMLSILQKDNKVGMVGARLLYTNTENLQHAGVVFHNTIQTPTHFRCNEKSDKNAEKNREFQSVTAAVSITRAELFKNTCTTNKSGNKGMDENYHWAFDDVDLCLSIKYNMGKKIVYCGNTNIYHEESASLKKNPTNKLFMHHNVNYLKNKWLKRYSLDQDIYTKDPKYNLYQG